jgi:hypothetical protein
VKYPVTSPYHLTGLSEGGYLDVMVNRPIQSTTDDQYWAITTVYNLRPDLLANDLYGDSRLWWVFAQRNPNKLKDPLYDFTTGTKIYLTPLSVLRATLGI